MKKGFICVAMISFLLAGCSQLDPYLDKLPFMQNKDQATEENADQNVDENQVGNPEVPEPTDKENVGEESLPEDGNQPGNNIPALEAAFFNEISTVDGKNMIQNPTNIMALVNKQFSLPTDYAPDDLVRPNVAYSFGDQDIEKSYIRKEAGTALESMFADAEKNGIYLFAVSGYRSYDRQTTVFNAEVNRVGQEQAVQAVAIPGFSEHQSGLAMDISSQSAGFALTEEFEATVEGKWLAENAYRFGFILRYPKGKEEITGYQYEPWHFRYIGIEAAKVIHEKKWTLEEYFDIVEKI